MKAKEAKTVVKTAKTEVKVDAKEEARKADMAKIDQLTKELAELSRGIDELVVNYNDAITSADFAGAKDVSDDIDEKVDEYSSKAWDREALKLRNTDDPMLSAARELTYTVVKVHKSKVKGSEQEVMDSTTKEVYIDPLELARKCRGSIGKDKNWEYMLEKLNFLFTCRRAIELGVDPTTIADNYAMAEQAIKLGMFLTPDTVTKYDRTEADNMLKHDMQAAVNAMIGDEFLVTDKMVMYLLMIYQKKSTKRALSVVCSNHKQFRIMMLEICHACAEEGGFMVEYKAKK